MANKPIVMYTGDALVYPTSYGDCARLYALDHPKLGRGIVRTSLVKDVKSNGTIETLNTIYVKVNDDNGTD